MAAMAAEPSGRIRIEGLDTILLLVRQWAEVFMATHPGVVVEVGGGGTATGIRALIAGDADVAAASRPLRPEESQQLVERHDAGAYEGFGHENVMLAASGADPATGDPHGVRLIDWELVAAGDPAWDVATLLQAALVRTCLVQAQARASNPRISDRTATLCKPWYVRGRRPAAARPGRHALAALGPPIPQRPRV